ncbi:MAG: cupin domain-containing protein [Acidobacteriota bacterium]
MKLFNWKDCPQEQMNDWLSRKFVTGQNITLAQLFLKKGCIVPEHSHESEQLSHVVVGCLRFAVDGQETVVRSNEVLAIPPNARHRVEAIEDTLVYDIFAPIRKDWLDGSDAYLRR